jgi:uncharacterized membrane protein YbhN (UPF0104 family)
MGSMATHRTVLTRRAAILLHRGEALAAAALGVALLAAGLPRVAGTSWDRIGDTLAQVSMTEVAALTVVWLAGLWVHTLALSAALPGLSHRRAFFLNLTGSAVSNVLPLGGAAGSAVNYWAARAWGFGSAAFLRWALVTNIWDVLGRLAVPGLALAWLSAAGSPSPALRDAAVAASTALLVLLVLTVVALRTTSWARAAGRVADRVGRRVRRPPPPGSSYAAAAVRAQQSVAGLVATAWVRLTVGKAGYAALQALLLWLCLDLVDAHPPAAVVFGAFAVERVLSLAVISPAATGIVELGMTGFLAALGADPGASAAGVVLYRIFVVGLEVPVGGLALLWWVGRRLLHHGGRPERSRLPDLLDVGT